MINWCKEQFGGYKIGVFALSMGTLIANIGYNKSTYDFFVGEAFVWSPSVNKQRILEIKNKELNLPEGAEKDEELVAVAHIPTLLFAGKNDEITTAMGSKQFCSSRTDSTTIEFDGGHLRGIVELGVQDYFAAIDKFIQG